jgi:hypothetical protein
MQSKHVSEKLVRISSRVSNHLKLKVWFRFSLESNLIFQFGTLNAAKGLVTGSQSVVNNS